jgi:hypothetical protein
VQKVEPKWKECVKLLGFLCILVTRFQTLALVFATYRAK